MKVLAVSLLLFSIQVSGSGSLGFGDGMKVWRQNTNFGNVRNWEGLVNENCSRNIFSFPGWMDHSVVAFPSSFIGKQIILPVNGHFVFQPGLTTLSDSGTCQHGREVKFRRTSKADWFDPNNWARISSSSGSGASSESNLFDKDAKAIPHVERVPCQFDLVKFPERSTFNLIIPQKVNIGKFFLGDQEQTYTDIAVMMNSKLGKLQFQKAPEIEFSLTKSNYSDDDDCICDNYKTLIRQKICSLSQCRNEEDECHNPIMPHGFCCPICGFHIKIKHTGTLKLQPIYQMLKQMVESGKLPKEVEFHVSRHQMKGAHIILIPMKNNMDQTTRMIVEILSHLKNEPQVVDVTWNGSWENIPSDVDKWGSEGLNGGVITLIVILILSLLIGVVCFIFYQNKGTYPNLSLSSMSNILPSMSMPNFTMPNFTIPSMQMPNINIPLPGRRESTVAGGRAFGFARFSNERVSTVNIERSAGNIERGEQVDKVINPVDEEVIQEKVTDASTKYGFTNVTYDIIGVREGSSSTELGPWESQQSSSDTQLLVDVNDAPATSGESTSESTVVHNIRIPGPAKPFRRANKDVKEEPIYNDVIEMTNDTAALFQPEPKSRDTEE